MKMKTKAPTKNHEAFRNDMIEAMRKHEHLAADELLAVASYFVGQLVAMQDQRKFSPAMAMEIVAQNIEAGNRQAISEVAAVGGPGN